MLANYREALKNPAVAHPNYTRLDLQRQTLEHDGTWSDWEDVDAEENLKILDNLPEEDEELTPENVRPDNLVDPLRSSRPALGEGPRRQPRPQGEEEGPESRPAWE